MWLLVVVFIYSFKASATVTENCPDTPSNERKVACSLPGNSDDSDSCTASDSVCCHDENADIQCRASDKYVCDLSGVSNGVSDKTTTTINGQTYRDSNSLSYSTVYPGEAVTFTCTEGSMFFGNEVVDSNTETVVQCVMDENYEVTDISAMFNSFKCFSSCQYVTFDAATQSLNVDVSVDSPQRYEYTITMTCNEGYGTASGDNSETFKCKGTSVDSPTTPSLCYRCDAPTDADLLEFGAFDMTDVIPNAALTYTCNDGYSIDGSTVKFMTSTCSTNGFPDTWVKCIADCILELYDDDNNVYSHVLSDTTASRTSVAVGSSVDIGCGDDAGLPVSQATTLTCSTSGETLKPAQCQPLCKLDGLTDATNRDIQIKTVDSDAYASPAASVLYVAYGTMISMACKNDYTVKYSEVDNLEFVAGADTYDAGTEGWTAPTCYETCSLLSLDGIGSTLFLVGINRTLTAESVMMEGEIVRIDCLEATDTVTGTILNYEDLSCSNGQPLTANKCAPPCQVSDFPDVNDDTTVSPSPIVGLKLSITLSCAADYRMGKADSFYTTSISSRCGYTDGTETATVLETTKLEDGAVPTDAQCYAYPTLISAAPDGESMIKVTLSLPSDRDASSTVKSLTVSTVAVASTTAEECEVTDLTASPLECTITLPAENDLQKYSITASLEFTSPSLIFSATDDAGTAVTLQSFAGPASLDLSTSSATLTATGVDSLNLVVSDSVVDAANAITVYTVVYTLEIFNSAGVAVGTTRTITLDSLKGAGEDFTDLVGLSAITSYTVKVTSSLEGAGDGGSSTMSFETGYLPPVVTSAVTHSTSNQFTITLGGGATYDGDLTVHIDGTAYVVTFASGVGTHTLEGLTAMQKYEYAVIVKSANGISSKTTDVTFTQGPTEPVLGSPTITNTGVTVTWTYTESNLYYLNLYLKDADGNYGTEADLSHTTTSDDGAVSSYMFSALDAGATYLVTACAEMDVDGVTVKSAVVSEEVLIFSCSSSDKLGNYALTYVISGDAVPADTYLLTDANTEFNVACSTIDDTEYGFVTEDGTYDNVTACIGPDTWASHSDCEEVTDPQAVTDEGSDVVVGIVLGILAVLIIVGIILILIYKRNKEKSNETNSKKYSPRDEEKNNEVDDNGGEAWRNPYYQDNDNEKKDLSKDDISAIVDFSADASNHGMDNSYGQLTDDSSDMKPLESPDIPDNKDVNGDNVSQEARVDFNDDEEENPYHQPEGVVIPNNNAAEANENV